MHGGSRCSVDTLWDQVGCQSNGLETGVRVHALGMGTKKPGVSSPRLVPQQEYRCLPPRWISYLAAFGCWRRHRYELRPWSAFQHWRLTRHLSQNEGCALAMMRSSYEVRVELPGGSKSLLVRASSRSEACRMAAEAHPDRPFVVIGRIDAIPALP